MPLWEQAASEKIVSPSLVTCYPFYYHRSSSAACSQGLYAGGGRSNPGLAEPENDCATVTPRGTALNLLFNTNLFSTCNRINA